MKTKILVCIALLFSCYHYALAQELPKEDSILWEASKNGKTIFILGTIHTGFIEQYPLRPKIQEAFRNSSIYVNESIIPFLATSDIQKKIGPVLRAKAGKTLKALLQEKQCKSVANKEEFNKKLKVVFNDKLLLKKAMTATPGAAIFLLSSPQETLSEEHADSLHLTQGVEFFLSDAAVKLEIRHESLDWELFDAINALDDMDVCNLVIGMASMRATGVAEEATYEIYLKLKNDWLAGDSLDMANLAFQWSPQLAAMYGDAERKWFEKRNEIMVKKMIEIDESASSPIFVAIGASHLAGTEGVISKLRRAGYEVGAL